MEEINFDTTKEEDVVILKIVKRAFKEPTLEILGEERQNLFMDLTATHCNGTPLDFEKLLGFDEFNFAHDIYGIIDSINRTTGKLENCFLPRCAKHE